MISALREENPKEVMFCQVACNDQLVWPGDPKLSPFGFLVRSALQPRTSLNPAWRACPLSISKLQVTEIPHLEVHFTLAKSQMAPKRSAREATPSSLSQSQTSGTAAGSTPIFSTKAPSRSASKQGPADIALAVWQNYLDTTPQRTKLIDIFMAFLVAVGGLQFVYCVIAGNYVRCLGSGGKVMLILSPAFQCLFVRILSYRWTICFDWYVRFVCGRLCC